MNARTGHRLLLSLLSLHLAVLLAACGRQATTEPVIWAVSGMVRVGQEERPDTSPPLELYAARGEYEPFQVVIGAPNYGLTNVSFAVSDLVSANGVQIESKNLTLYREHYVYVPQASPGQWGPNRSLGAGWYADALIPFVDPATGGKPAPAPLRAQPFDLKAATNQPIWVDVFVPYDARAGAYRGTFTVTSDQGSFTSSYTLTVWNFALPRKPALVSSFELWQDRSPQARIELLKHRLMPKNNEPETQRALIDRYGLNANAIGLWSGADSQNCAMEAPPDVARLLRIAKRQQPDILVYNHTADEIDSCTQLYEQLKLWGRNLHEAGIANLVTMAPRPELFDDGSGSGRPAVDIWAVLPLMYDTDGDQIAAALRQGQQVWSYTALAQDGYSPKWLIDYDPINFRIQPGFISQSLGLTGLLYWRVDLWTDDPWNDVGSLKRTEGTYSGEGMLVYPGAQVGIAGVAPSMRLKWLREGVEDYDYVQILKQRNLGAAALEITRDVGKDWRTWTRDVTQLEAARRKLAQAIIDSEPATSIFLPNVATPQ